MKEFTDEDALRYQKYLSEYRGEEYSNQKGLRKFTNEDMERYQKYYDEYRHRPVEKEPEDDTLERMIEEEMQSQSSLSW
jgi:hypothetical protein